MGFLNETGGNLRATWQNLSIVARGGLALAAVAIVATSIWWSWRAPEVSHVALFPGQTLAPSELVAMEAAFGRARLNGARLVDGHFEVPAERKDDYVRALIDNQALPATPASFSERLIAQDNLFTSPRQREALMKLAKEREIALMVRQIAGIAEATVHYEDVDGEGFPRRKSRRATIAVRTRSERPLAPQLVHAIRTTVANSLGITSADAIAVLDLNEGIAYTEPASKSMAPANSPQNSPEQRSTPGAPIRHNVPETQTGERSAERTGPIQLATFDSLAPDSLPMEPLTIPTNAGAVAAADPSSDKPATATPRPAAEKQNAEKRTGDRRDVEPRNVDEPDANEPDANEPDEPRLLPKSILQMVRPASHEERDGKRPAAIPPPAREPAAQAPNVNQHDGRERASRVNRTLRPASDASPSPRPSRSRAQLTPVAPSASAPATGLLADRNNSQRSAHWRTWLRDHGPTVGGCGAGLGLMMWLLRALLAARWDARTAPEMRVERREPRSDHATTEQVGVPAAAASDARRELADRVRADKSTAAAKLRQWLGHAA